MQYFATSLLFERDPYSTTILFRMLNKKQHECDEKDEQEAG